MAEVRMDSTIVYACGAPQKRGRGGSWGIVAGADSVRNAYGPTDR